MASPSPLATPGFQTIDGQSDVVFDDSSPEPAEPPSQAPREGRARMLMSPATSAAVDSAFNTLAHTVLVQNARTLEDLVREMLAPLLKTWLDDNLPRLVERLVRAEIERVSRGRG
jgi:cell pole-organizing protein PopZ